MRLSQLIELYLFICEIYEENLQYHCMRFTNNQQKPDFTDQELLTAHLFTLIYERKLRIKDAYEYIKHHWLDCFPDLPSYQAYNSRLNRLAGVFPILAEYLQEKYQSLNTDNTTFSYLLTDSMPIITCAGNRQAKVALDLCDKGYNSTKKMYYYGVKLHGMGAYRKGCLPVMEYFKIGKASEHDLKAQRADLEQVRQRLIFADKAFCDSELNRSLIEQKASLCTPTKYPRGHSEYDKQQAKAFDDLWSKNVSSIKQSIESFFGWLIEKTDIQKASKVRSTKGLLVHIFGRIVGAFILLDNRIINFSS